MRFLCELRVGLVARRSAGNTAMLSTNSFKRRNRLAAILFLTAKLLRLDDDHAVFGDALIVELQQALFEFRRQRRGMDIETQMHRARHLVHVLPPAPCARTALISIS